MLQPLLTQFIIPLLALPLRVPIFVIPIYFHCLLFSPLLTQPPVEPVRSQTKQLLSRTEQLSRDVKKLQNDMVSVVHAMASVQTLQH